MYDLSQSTYVTKHLERSVHLPIVLNTRLSKAPKEHIARIIHQAFINVCRSEVLNQTSTLKIHEISFSCHFQLNQRIFYFKFVHTIHDLHHIGQFVFNIF